MQKVISLATGMRSERSLCPSFRAAGHFYYLSQAGSRLRAVLERSDYEYH